VLTCSGTAALVIALKTLHKMHPGRTGVIIPAYTCPLVLMAVRLVPGLRPIICDTRPGGFDFDTLTLAEHCNSETLAIVPAHLGGRVADIATVREIAQKRGAFVLEDAAQAMGAFNQGVSVGLEGDIGFFSLAVGKGLTTYEGGILFSRHPELAAALKATARETLRLNLLLNCRRFIELAAYTLLYSPTRLKYVYGRKLKRELAKNNEVEAVGDFFTTADIHLHSLDSLRLRVAGNALERLPEFLEQGRIRAEKRLEYFSGLAGVDVITDRPDASGGTKGVWPFFMLLLPGKEQRDSALAKLWTKGLGVSKLFAHALPDYAYLHEPSAAHTDRAFDCVNARDFSSRMLTISNTHWMDEKTFALIAQEVRSVL
jgi:dTDP-4-amino-4,6-dideoxygalactose transaminase